MPALIAARPRRTARSSASSPGSAAPSTPRIADLTSVTVSIVATASYNAVESNTRRRPTNPARLAVSNTTAKIRSGRSDAANRARISTSTVCTNPG